MVLVNILLRNLYYYVCCNIIYSISLDFYYGRRYKGSLIDVYMGFYFFIKNNIMLFLGLCMKLEILC